MSLSTRNSQGADYRGRAEVEPRMAALTSLPFATYPPQAPSLKEIGRALSGPAGRPAFHVRAASWIAAASSLRLALSVGANPVAFRTKSTGRPQSGHLRARGVPQTRNTPTAKHVGPTRGFGAASCDLPGVGSTVCHLGRHTCETGPPHDVAYPAKPTVHRAVRRRSRARGHIPLAGVDG